MTVKRASTTVEADTTLTTTSETVVATLDAPSPNRAGVIVTVRGWAQLTSGTGTTAVTPRIRRGTTVSGDLVGEGNPVDVTAGDTADHSITTDDPPGEVSSLNYVLTLEQTGATADGTAVQASLSAEYE